MAPDDEEGDLWGTIRRDGREVGRLEWDSGGPAGGGLVAVWAYRGVFYACNDVEEYPPFPTFEEAAKAAGIFFINEATTSVWVDPEFCDRDVKALNAKAAELRRAHEEKWRKQT